jgi:hypothetical protein
MKRVMWLVPAILFFCVSAKAQDVPAWELQGGYSYLWANVSGSSFHMQGGQGSLSENFNDWFGGSFQFAAYGGTLGGTNVTAQTITYGPVFSYRRFDRLTPYAHVQFGAVHASSGYLGISESAFKFAIAPGVGADFRVNDRFGIRGQADYLMTRYLNARQDNMQFSVGLVLYLGKQNHNEY